MIEFARKLEYERKMNKYCIETSKKSTNKMRTWATRKEETRCKWFNMCVCVCVDVLLKGVLAWHHISPMHRYGNEFNSSKRH